MKRVSSRARGRRWRSALHPLAWWAWATGLAVVAIESTNPLLLLLIAGVLANVVAARRRDSPTSRSLLVFLRLGLWVIALRVVLQVLFGDRVPGDVVFSLPRVPLPHWAAGVSIGGAVTAQSLLASLCQGLRLAVVLLAFGAANTLANPYRLLRSLPAVLYEAGVAVTVSLSYAPELVDRITEVRGARRLRGRPTRGLRGLKGMAIPVLEGALDRSLELAASMDARGYGRRTPTAPRARRTSTVAGIGGLSLVLLGVYELLTSSGPRWLGLGALGAGLGALVVSLAWSGRRVTRTRYRPDVWRGSEWIVLGTALAAVLTVALAGTLHEGGLSYATGTLTWPQVPLVPTFGVLVGIVPAWIAPHDATRARAARPSGADVRIGAAP